MSRDTYGAWLDELPVKAGFRLRGLEATRLETFTDAAFAFALTLLVISLEPPYNMEMLFDALRQIPAFVLSASMLMMFWWGHHEWSRRFGLDDGPTLILSCLLVFTVLVYVVPLRFMFGLLFVWLGFLTDLPLGPRGMTVNDPLQVNTMFAVYGAGFVAMSLSLVLLNVHALRRRDELRLSPAEAHGTVTEAVMWSITAATGAVSALVALLVPPSMIGLPGWVYMVLPVVTPIYGIRRDRARKALEAAEA